MWVEAVDERGVLAGKGLDRVAAPNFHGYAAMAAKPVSRGWPMSELSFWQIVFKDEGRGRPAEEGGRASEEAQVGAMVLGLGTHCASPINELNLNISGLCSPHDDSHVLRNSTQPWRAKCRRLFRGSGPRYL